MIAREDFAIRADDRGVLCGTTGCGKSTLASILINLFYQDYVKYDDEPEGRILIVDSKPRWRHDHLLSRFSKQSSLPPGDPQTIIRHSVLVRDAGEWKQANRSNEPVILLQNPDLPMKELIPWLVVCMEDFFKTQHTERKSLLYIDEGMDFFGPSGNGLHGDIIQRCYRAGREKGLATVTGIQRPKQINLQVLTESNYLALFHLRFADDVTRIYEMGFPVGMMPPEENYHFSLWHDGLISQDVMLDLSDSTNKKKESIKV